MSETFFFDTYALVEIYRGNKNYLPYVSNIGLMLTKLNLLEFIHFLIREGKENEISEYIEKLNRFIVRYNDEVLVDAAKMKFKYKHERLSFVDCIGYFIAKKNGVKFLTGDIKFKDKENVEFVK